MSEKIKIGVIGQGHLGKIHSKLILESGLFEHIGFYDPNNENASESIEKYHLKRYSNADELISDADCIDIVCPTLFHFEYAEKSIKKAKHIFIEKPITSTLEEAKSIIALKNEAKVAVQIGHVERFNPAFEAALPNFYNPMFIEAHRLAQFNPRGTDVSVVLDLMIHDIDIILSVVNSPVKSVSASGVAVVSNTPDITNARIEFYNGCVANITASRISMKNMRKTRFFQRDAYIAVDFLEKKTQLVKMKKVAGEPGPFDLVFDMGDGTSKKQIYFETPEVNETNAIKKELEEFYFSVKDKKPVKVTAEDGLKALEVAHLIIEKIDKSINQELS